MTGEHSQLSHVVQLQNSGYSHELNAASNQMSEWLSRLLQRQDSRAFKCLIARITKIMAFNEIEIYSWFYSTLLYLIDTYDSGNRFQETSLIELLLVSAIQTKEFMFMPDDTEEKLDRTEITSILNLNPPVLETRLAKHRRYTESLSIANLNAFVQVLQYERASQNGSNENVRDLNRIVDNLVNEKSNQPAR
jgi:hypothetical protein